MNAFTIKDIEHLTGIRAHTIRIWEQRYNLFQPRRKATNHRVYSNNDLRVLLRVALLYHNGMKISRIAAMDEATLMKEVQATAVAGSRYLPYINQLIEATLQFDQQRLEQVFHNMLLHTGLERGIREVVYPFLEKVGVLWLTNHLLPAQEHFASQIIRRKLMVAIDGQAPPLHDGRHYLLFLPEGELHEIPLLFMQYLLRQQRRMVTYFGPNVPLEDMPFFTGQKKVTHVCTHLISSFTRKAINEFAGRLTALFPDCSIVLSGPQTRHISASLPPNVRLLRSREEVDAFVKEDA